MQHVTIRPTEARPADGGFSGGTMERPALQQLLSHIRQVITMRSASRE